jgi:hypothetical protein
MVAVWPYVVYCLDWQDAYRGARACTGIWRYMQSEEEAVEILTTDGQLFQCQLNRTQPFLQLRYQLELGLGLLGSWARKLLEIYYAGSKVDLHCLEIRSRRAVVHTPTFTPIGGNLQRVHIHMDFATLEYTTILEHLPLREWLDPWLGGWEDDEYRHGWISYEDSKWHHEVWDSAERRWTYDGRVSEDGTWHHKIWDSEGKRWTYEDPGKV